NTDVDEQRSSASERQSTSTSNSSSNSLNTAPHHMPPYKDLTPLYVIKNVM
ncbi:hypothetical protein NL108_001989, partial [Boleophthalmus pectinirostris]